MKFLALYLRAPMQSWGVSSKFGERTTFDAPTRSGLLGMLAAACGVDKNDDATDCAWLARAAKVSLCVLSFHRGDRITDYHTVGGGFNEDNPWQKRMIPTTANGKPRGTDLTHRDYLTDTVFGAVLAGDDVLLGEMAAKLANPIWGVWLGRKSCIPTEPILAGVFDSEDEAKNALAKRFCASIERSNNGENMGNAVAFSVLEATVEDAEETLLDVPVSFARREFHARRIRREYPEEE